MAAKKGKWRWVNIRITSDTVLGRIVIDTVRGYTAPQIAGLAVTRGFGEFEGRWVITHRGTGAKLPTLAFPSRREACRAAERFAPLGDWTRDPKAVERDKRLERKTRTLAQEISADSAPVRVGSDET